MPATLAREVGVGIETSERQFDVGQIGLDGVEQLVALGVSSHGD